MAAGGRHIRCCPHGETRTCTWTLNKGMTTDVIRREESFQCLLIFPLPAGYGLQLLFGGTRGDYANPGLNACVPGSVLFPRRYIFLPVFLVLWVDEHASPASLLRIFRGSGGVSVGSRFLTAHPGIICPSSGRRRLITSVDFCELPHNHDLTFAARRRV